MILKEPGTKSLGIPFQSNGNAMCPLADYVGKEFQRLYLNRSRFTGPLSKKY